MATFHVTFIDAAVILDFIERLKDFHRPQSGPSLTKVISWILDFRNNLFSTIKSNSSVKPKVRAYLSNIQDSFDHWGGGWGALKYAKNIFFKYLTVSLTKVIIMSDYTLGWFQRWSIWHRWSSDQAKCPISKSQIIGKWPKHDLIYQVHPIFGQLT